MRSTRHLLSQSKTGKSAVLRIEVHDSLGKKTVNFSSVKSWRKDLALKHLSFESNEWNANVTRVHVGLEVLKCARSTHEAIKFINALKSLNSMEVNFWSNKFLTDNRTKKAWRSFYG